MQQFLVQNSGIGDEQIEFRENNANRGRGNDTPARLSAISCGETLKHVIQRNFARVPDASSVLDRLYALAASVACYRLAYSDPEEAADLLGASRRAEDL